MPRKKTGLVDERIRDLYYRRADFMLKRAKALLDESVDDRRIAFYASKVRHWEHIRDQVLMGRLDHEIAEWERERLNRP